MIGDFENMPQALAIFAPARQIADITGAGGKKQPIGIACKQYGV
jgi:hypothetical protein